MHLLDSFPSLSLDLSSHGTRGCAYPNTITGASNTTTLLGKYQLGRLLGRGSFAKVYQALSIVDDTVVAVKIIDKSKTVDATMEPRRIGEIMPMRRLQDHPNILKILKVMATKTKIYLVVELTTGDELFSKISCRGKLVGPSVRRYFQQLVSALHFYHQNGVAHSNVKSALHFCHQNERCPPRREAGAAFLPPKPRHPPRREASEPPGLV
ncbi:hypothetical protein F2P56_001434 [Juglans regia]|uniref:Protein kinase domain-containing protein n=2 Tax=Juglans regia TaxID=51240 RepID=A0A833YDR4_JUGRE|nr:CBL-interacting serine/threonine-protein kinase 7-like [Juglans regia]KAF5480709.1 hypothetical protein F2P56_001434 [Juglans regia]